VEHQELYSIIEKIIAKAVPSWNIVLQCHHDANLGCGPRAGCRSIEYELPEDEYESSDEFVDIHIYDKPEPNSFEALTITAEHVRDCFAFLEGEEKKLQVIVKLANIHLTPDKPDYDGGSWHIEGQLNEHIVATALYYDNDNITDSHISFQTKVDTDDFSEHVSHPHSDGTGVELIFGMGIGDRSAQVLGSVPTREDRLIAFPNGFQNRVGSLKLADMTRPGHRKVLALFLVDPTCPIISTANIPPQQRDWWLRRVKALESRVSQLPVELVDLIGEEVQDFPIGLDEAKELREEVMTEREMMDKTVDSHMTPWKFSYV
jgi:hypothetical protein